MAKKQQKELDMPRVDNTDIIEIVANAIVHIRKKRMELK